MKSSEEHYQKEKYVNLRLQQSFNKEELDNIVITMHNFDDEGLKIYYRLGCISLNMYANLLLASKSCFSEEELWYMMVTLANHISALHDKQFSHNDVKPSNIVLVHEGARYVLKLVDLGSCTEGEEQNLFFTPAYFPKDCKLDTPEKKYRADLYGVGRTLEILIVQQIYGKDSSEL